MKMLTMVTSEHVDNYRSTVKGCYLNGTDFYLLLEDGECLHLKGHYGGEGCDIEIEEQDKPPTLYDAYRDRSFGYWLIENGVCTLEELQDYENQEAQKYVDSETNRQRKEYERLKKIFEKDSQV